jgi:excisionase family DNA binding protein
MDTTLTVTEAAAFLGVSRTTVWAMVRDGRLPASPDPVDRRRKRIPRAALAGLRDGQGGNAASRPWPRSIGIYDGPVDVPARDAEEYMAEHWRSP